MSKNEVPASDAPEHVETFYSQYTTDQNLEKGDGVVLDYGKLGTIRIHRAGGTNQRFKNYTRAKLAPYTRQINNNTLDEDVSRQLTADIYARTVIVGWEGVRGRDGRLLEFNYENCVRLLTDLPELFDDIQKAAQDVSNFRAAVNADIEGNS